MQWQDLCALVHDALERDTQQHRDSENIAMLLDRDNFYLDAEYQQWITDPNDPKVKADHLARKQRGVTPPPKPMLYPVALRRPELAEIHMTRYREIAEHYASPAADRPMTLAEVLKMRKR